jgi:membrane-bound lytic murein transglycosylase D
LVIACCPVQNAVASQGVIRKIDTTSLMTYYSNAVREHQNLVQYIEFTLRGQGLPELFSNLALVESGFDAAAVSEKGAMGIWQLMPGTATDFGLPEAYRDDVYKSTQVAVRVIARLYRRLNDPLMVVAAYSCGEGCVRSAMKQAGSHLYTRVKLFLPSESVGHVGKFMLACRATGKTLPQQPTANPPPWQPPPGMMVTAIGSGYRLAVIAELLGIDLQVLSELNPEWEQQMSDSGRVSLILPADKMPDFLLLQHEILNRSLLN